MRRKDIFVETVIFNPDLLRAGVALRLEGINHEGDDMLGNYIIFRNEGYSLRIVGESGGMERKCTIDVQDVEEGLKLIILAER